MIGLAKVTEGLYVLQKSPTLAFSSVVLLTVVNSSFSPNNFKHYILGHPSQTRLAVLNKNCPLVTCNSMHMPCDVFHLAKQKKLSFSSSTCVTSKVFQLVHVDIWGSLFAPSIHGHKHFLIVVDDFSRHRWAF